MTLDTSALVAILLSEPGFLDLVDRILEADVVRVGTATLAETTIVFAHRRKGPATARVNGLVEELGITVVPFGATEWQVAAAAYEQFGRGKHKAALNFGDCLAYATAKVAGDSLLFVGNDFSKTDIKRA